MSSRLDRLFILLESGSSPATRRAAANQLGEVGSISNISVKYCILSLSGTEEPPRRAAQPAEEGAEVSLPHKLGH